MAEVLRAHGVKFVFTLVGGHISPILVACEKLGIRIVDTRHEATAVFAADAVARLSGKTAHKQKRTDHILLEAVEEAENLLFWCLGTVGVAAVTAGPGLTNTVTAVKNAQMAESPLLLIGGAAATLLQVRKCLIEYESRTRALHAHVTCVFALCSGYLFFIFLSVSCANIRY